MYEARKVDEPKKKGQRKHEDGTNTRQHDRRATEREAWLIQTTTTTKKKERFGEAVLFISLFVLMGLIKPSLQVFFFTTCTSSNVVHIYAAPSLLNRCTLNTVARRKKEVRET